MKTIDVTRRVMGKVVRYERRHTLLWLGRFFTVIVVLGGAALTFMLVATRDLFSRDAFSVFSLFGEDWEIITEYWRDVLAVFWEELPKETLFLGALAILAIATIIIITRNQRRIIRRKREQLISLEKKF